jgi:hypothetical protein
VTSAEDIWVFGLCWRHIRRDRRNALGLEYEHMDAERDTPADAGERSRSVWTRRVRRGCVETFDEGRFLSRGHKDTEMNENAIGILSPDPPCLGASVRAIFRESGGPLCAAPPRS